MMARRIIRLALVLGFICLAACRQSVPDSPKETTKDKEAETFPPAELIVSNIKETQASVALVFKTVETVKAPQENDIYGEWKIQAIVKRTFKGDFKPGDSFVFFWRFEKGIAAPNAESAWIGSFDRNEKGDYYVPDNGYVFEASKALENLFEKAVAEKGK
ncbi:MAG: hypothetical protein EHM45_08870 [Desulfobacteraceae bacterium]|nr:MAG: hypothetical protein EHM45_08870 [Desulfobacteraceae bacterium]